MNYLKLLNDGYKFNHDELGSLSKLEYLGENIFDFTTYENIVLEKMTTKAIEVLNAITKRTTFDYIEDKENNFWFLIMVNMPFFIEKINWGTSIRGAWWDIHDATKKMFKIDTCGLWDGFEQVTDPEFNFKQWHDFIKAINDFIKE